MKYAYYPGCSLHCTAKEYDRSLNAVCARLGIELAEIKNWFCCGSTSAHCVSADGLLSAALSMGNLAIMREAGSQEVVVPCPSCFSRFKSALYKIASEPRLEVEIEQMIKDGWSHNIKIYHPLQIFSEESQLAKISSLVKHELTGLKVVCYYGCLLTRPPKVVQFDSCEYPESMDRLLRILGTTTLDWCYKTDCCGASFALTRTDIVLKLCRDILEGAKSVGADVIAVACPLCQINLDMRQDEINKTFGTNYQVPILYFTQLMGISFGLPLKEQMLRKHLVRVERKLEEVLHHA
jgi:heterodisulfide reductase subunit B